MSSIKAQANTLVHNLHALLRGSGIDVRIHRTPHNMFCAYASRYCKPLNGGEPVGEFEDLTLDCVPYILDSLARHTGTRIGFTVYVTARTDKPTRYYVETDSAIGQRRISAKLASSVHESAIRDDELTVTFSTRLDYVSFCEYRDVWQYMTHSECCAV